MFRAGLAVVVLLAAVQPAVPAQSPFDHGYGAYAALLDVVVREPRVDYRALQARDAELRAIEGTFNAVSRVDVDRWSREQQIAFWSNAYNVFTLRAILDHYPIKGSVFSLGPKNSIRQISGVWDRLQWSVAGQRLTLDHIEHKILRPAFTEPLVHFAVNCASVSCPVVAREPYRADQLQAQLENAARKYLVSPLGLSLAGNTLQVSSIFKWYGEDFVARFRDRGPSTGSDTDRAILGVVITYGPEAAAAVARSGRARVRFLDYDWSLNDVVR
ncbi:MAG: DUF547 domain-containing protein [Vicinamibacterales bacterium]